MSKIVDNVSKDMRQFITKSAISSPFTKTIDAIKKTLWCLVVSPLIKNNKSINEGSETPVSWNSENVVNYQFPGRLVIFGTSCQVSITGIGLSKLGISVLHQISRLPSSMLNRVVTPALESIIESRIKRGLFIIKCNKSTLHLQVDTVLSCVPTAVYTHYIGDEGTPASNGSVQLLTFIQRLGSYIKEPNKQLNSFLVHQGIKKRYTNDGEYRGNFDLDVACIHYLYEGINGGGEITKASLLADALTYRKLIRTFARGVLLNTLTDSISERFNDVIYNLQRPRPHKRAARRTGRVSDGLLTVDELRAQQARRQMTTRQSVDTYYANTSTINLSESSPTPNRYTTTRWGNSGTFSNAQAANPVTGVNPVYQPRTDNSF
jgi:hypothetical protein